MSQQLAHASTILVGRTAERERLQSSLESAHANRGSLILLEGDAGIGKTTLAEALVEIARQLGFIVAVGHAYDRTEAAPYSIWHEALRAIGLDTRIDEDTRAELIRTLTAHGAEQSRADLFNRVIATFNDVSSLHPILLVLEDLHWADQASLEMLRVLAREVSGRAIQIVGTYRADDGSRRNALIQALPNLVREARAERISLQPLDRDQIVDFVRAQYGSELAAEERLIGHLWDHTEGNPLFLEELMRALVTSGTIRQIEDRWQIGELGRVAIPPLVKQLISDRLAGLSAETSRALQAAAVVGQVVPYDIWRAALELDDAELGALIREALAANVMHQSADGEHLEFAHAVVRDVIYDELIIPERRHLHQRVAEVLMALPDGDPDAIASHLSRANDPRAVEWLILAGNRAQRAYALRMAADRFQAALQLSGTPREATNEYGWLLYRTGRLMRFADPAGAVAYMSQAEQVGREIGDPALAAFAIADRGLMRSFEGEVRAGLSDIETGLKRLNKLADAGTHISSDIAMWIQDMVDPSFDRLESASDPAEIERVPTAMRWGAHTAWLASAGYFERSRELGERYLRDAPTAPGGVWVGLARSYAAMGQPELARDAMSRAIAIVTGQSNYVLVGQFAANQLEEIELPFWSDDLGTRRRLQDVAESAWSQATEALPSQVPTRCASLSVLLLEGEWFDALQLARIEAERGFAMHRPRALATQASVLTWQGDYDRALTFIRQLLPDGPATEPGDSAIFAALEAQKLAIEIALTRGEADRARRWIDMHHHWLEWSGATGLQPDADLLLARYERRFGDPASARRRLDAVINRAQNPRRPLVLLAAHRELGDLLIDEESLDTALEHLKIALDLAHRCEAYVDHALTLQALARHAIATGDLSQAAQYFEQARERLEHLGAQPALASLMTLADQIYPDAKILTAPARQRPQRDRPANLTEREAEVLQLVASGMSNREIASALDLSIRTIERHVSNIYNKIDAHNRVDATAFAIRHNVI